MSDLVLIVYCAPITSRIDYIFSTLLTALGVTHYNLTSDVSLYKSSGLARLNYSASRLTPDEFYLNSTDLLFEKTIYDQAIKCHYFKGTRAFYETVNSDFPFDIFAASFYLLSRYEEYLPHTPDMYGRYGHENSLAYKEGFLKEPVVNIWLQQFKQALLEKFPFLMLLPATYRFLPTYDIDMAWSYLHKGIRRNAAGIIKSSVHGKWGRVGERVSVITGKQQDPFDSFGWLHKLHKEYGLEPSYFFLIAAKNKHYDKNILPSCGAFRKLIQDHAARYDVAIHPSWQSGDKPELLHNELSLLKAITAKDIYKSRQHYIRMSLPDTYRRLIDAGIREDYSMGYGSINGFRASYCLPFKWYDLAKEETTTLTIFPFCYMDANAYYEQRYSCEQALEEMNYYGSVIKKVNGLYISIWHNHFLGTDPMFKGWKDVYKKAIEKVSF